MITTLKFNLSNSPIRRETLHGKQYIVAPMAMLTEGVHNGSGGPLLYRESECKRATPSWNNKPIVVYHPEINGQGVSVCDPIILETQQIGHVMNCVWNGKLRADAWIDEDRANLVDSRVIDALENNKLMEVSTGLFTTNTGDPGTWNGKDYVAEARDHQPDHLAILPDKIGACSIMDGAGLLQINEAAEARGCDVTGLLAREMDTLRRVVGNAMSHSDVFSGIATALRKRTAMEDVWVVDVYPKFFIYDMSGKLYQLGYTTDKTGIEITGDATEVERVTEYKTVKDNKFVGNTAQPNAAKDKELVMKKEEIIANLIANIKTIWNEEDRATLEGLDTEVLTKMNTEIAPTEAPTAPVTDPVVLAANKGAEGVNPTPAPMVMSTEEYIANAPAGIRDVLTNALSAQEASKTELIATITANALNRFTPDFLATKGLGELQGIAALAAPAPVANQAHTPIPMFQGAATLMAPVTNAGNDQDEGLSLPSMVFGDA